MGSVPGCWSLLRFLRQRPSTCLAGWIIGRRITGRMILTLPEWQSGSRALFEEVMGLFGDEVDGLVVELEFCDGEAPHRIPMYNTWPMKITGLILPP